VTGNCLCYLALAFAPNIYVAFFVRLLAALRPATRGDPGLHRDVTPPDERNGKMSWLGAAYNLGFIVGPALGGMLANPAAGHAVFRIPLLVASSLSAICVVGLIFFLKESRVAAAPPTGPSRLGVVANALTNPVIAA